VPHGPILPAVDVVVGHGGLSTITGALAAGTPLVIVPQGRDQDDNAERVHRTGVGLSLPRDADAAAITAAILRVLREPSFRIAAQRMGAEIAAAGRGTAATAIVHREVARAAAATVVPRAVAAG
jgi:UDP:flavonoid glycosyltransferase YjiC (YdhE family)